MNKNLLIFPTNFYDAAIGLPGEAFKFLMFITLRKIKSIDIGETEKNQQLFENRFNPNNYIDNLMLLTDAGYFTTNAESNIYTTTFDYK